MMQLHQLLEKLPSPLHYRGPDMPIQDIAYDSRKVQKDSLFVAIRGLKEDGHDYIPDALAKGAGICIVEKKSSLDCPQILVPDSRIALAELSRAFYVPPHFPRLLAGVSGTNGKTTITHLLYQLANAVGVKAALLGTLGIKTPDYLQEAERTTPESRDIYNSFRDFEAEDIQAVFMEVSSHAIALKRVYGLKFNTAIFSNLSRDHLDFHSDMEEYFYTKAELFQNADFAVINIDDTYGKRLAKMCKGKVISYALREESADVHYQELRVSIKGIHGVLATPVGEIAVNSPLLGDFNAENIAATIAASLQLFPEKAALFQNFHFQAVPGRMEHIPTSRGSAVIDYAHSPDAMKKALKAARDLEGLGRIISVFGCGGERDQGKRPIMGSIAERYSDYIILCNDNPRFEEPLSIIEAIQGGIRDRNRTEICIDRAAAIRRAYSFSEPGDIIMILGKGAETYMEIKGGRIPFQDKKIVLGLE